MNGSGGTVGVRRCDHVAVALWWRCSRRPPVTDGVWAAQALGPGGGNAEAGGVARIAGHGRISAPRSGRPAGLPPAATASSTPQ